MKKVSFEEIGGVVATFLAESDVSKGMAVGMSGQERVGIAVDGGSVIGVAVEASPDGVAGVQVSGFAAVPYHGGITPGWVPLVANGSGGVRKAAAGETGHEFLVVRADAVAKQAVVLL